MERIDEQGAVDERWEIRGRVQLKWTLTTPGLKGRSFAFFLVPSRSVFRQTRHTVDYLRYVVDDDEDFTGFIRF